MDGSRRLEFAGERFQIGIAPNRGWTDEPPLSTVLVFNNEITFLFQAASHASCLPPNIRMGGNAQNVSRSLDTKLLSQLSVFRP